jgi:NodT family efflux transporter outer membrane factor (OMF) lipoprotein
MKFAKVFFFSVFGLLSAGCAVGPNFHGGVVPKAQAYLSTSFSQNTVAAPTKLGSAQSFIKGKDIPYQWWTLFQSKKLDTLIRQALENNPTLAAAEATLREARENVNAQIGSEYYPNIKLDAVTSRQKIFPASFGIPGMEASTPHLYSASVMVSYAFDIFGGGRREIEALKAKVDYERFRLEAAHLTISGDVVTTVIKEATLHALIHSTDKIIADQEKQLEFLEEQLAVGSISRSEVLSQRALLEATRSMLPSYEKDLSRTRHQLLTLLGKLPSEEASIPEFDLYEITLPAQLPVSLPSELTRQRPDVRAAEALLHAASAKIGVATANLYPQITLGGGYGPVTGRLVDLLKGESLSWGVGAGIVGPIFNGGSLRAQKRGAIAVYTEATAHFRETVISAYQNVADVLIALEQDAMILKAQANAEATARDTLRLSRQQFKEGVINYVLVLNAECQYQQSRISLVQAQAARLADTAALFQSLGGGWWGRRGAIVK